MKIIDILLRILVLPAYMLLSLIRSIFVWIMWNINFIRYGGETIAYTKKHDRKTIADTYEKVSAFFVEKRELNNDQE